MNNCEFFEKQISDQHDTDDIRHNREVLQRHLRDCQSCREFQQSVMAMAEQVYGLGRARPHSSQPNLENAAAGGWLSRIWRFRIPVPVPLATAFVVSAALLWVFNPADSQQQRQNQPRQHEQKLISVVLLTPVSAHRIDSNK